MKKDELSKVIKELKEKNKKNFNQTVDLIFTFKNLDLKKQDNQLDFSIILHNPKGKEVKTCALVGPETKVSAEENCTTTILVDDFARYAKDKKLLKKIAVDHDFFIAQANIMAKVASSFGRVLGPKGKMPNPKAGCVVPPGANLKLLTDKLQRTVKVTAKTAPMVQLMAGKEDMDEEQLIDNILTIEEAVINHLPGGKAQLKGSFIKLTMSKPVRLE